MFITHSYAGDIDATKQHMLAKNWTREELERVGDTPGLLMINVDFDVFEPREHPWLHLGFGNAIRHVVVAIYCSSGEPRGFRALR